MLRAMSTPPRLTDRTALLRNRTRAAQNPVTFLHDIAAEELHDRLSVVNKTFNAPVIVSGHPEYWRKAMPGMPHDIQVVNDDDVLGLDPGAHDLVLHIFSLHWTNDPVGQMIQSLRALKPDGLFLAVMFGGQTLHELRASLAQAESETLGGLSPRVAPMAEIRDLGALLQRAGFALPVADSVPLKTSYETPLHLMKELRAMGETNALAARLRHMSPRRLFTRASEIYQQAFPTDDNRIVATFDLIFLSGWSPDPSQQQPLRPGSAQTRLAEALGVPETPLKTR